MVALLVVSGNGLGCLLLIVLWALPSWAQQGSKAGGSKNSDSAAKEPILISADHMEMDQKRNVIRYQGNVVAVRGDVTLKSDTLTATYDPVAKRIADVVAEGKLVVTQGDRTATGNKAVFDSRTNTVILTGDPEVRQGNSQVSGSRIIMYINEDRGVVEGGKERVKAVIYPEELGSKGLGVGIGK